MDIYEIWAKALKNTEIIRPRVHGLATDRETHVPYIMLSASSINTGDTVVRKGEILVEKPSVLLPPASPQFEGFESENSSDFQQDAFINFLLVRGVTLPSLRYNNTTSSMEVFEGDIDQAVNHHANLLQRQENVHTGLITGLEDYWQFSVMVYICSVIGRNAANDIRTFLKEFKDRN